MLHHLRAGCTMERAQRLLEADGAYVTMRTLQRDIDQLRQMGIHIDYSDDLKRYAVHGSGYAREFFRPLLEVLR